MSKGANWVRGKSDKDCAEVRAVLSPRIRDEAEANVSTAKLDDHVRLVEQNGIRFVSFVTGADGTGWDFGSMLLETPRD